MEVSTYQRLMCSCSYDGRSNGRDAIEGCNKNYNDYGGGIHGECIEIVDIRDYKWYWLTMTDRRKRGEED